MWEEKIIHLNTNTIVHNRNKRYVFNIYGSRFHPKVKRINDIVIIPKREGGVSLDIFKSSQAVEASSWRLNQRLVLM